MRSIIGGTFDPARNPMAKITQSVDLAGHGRVAVLTVDNPPVNALSQHVRKGLHEGLGRAASGLEIDGLGDLRHEFLRAYFIAAPRSAGPQPRDGLQRAPLYLAAEPRGE